jgi:hypothetical protein
MTTDTKARENTAIIESRRLTVECILQIFIHTQLDSISLIQLWTLTSGTGNIKIQRSNKKSDIAKLSRNE